MTTFIIGTSAVCALVGIGVYMYLEFISNDFWN